MNNSHVTNRAVADSSNAISLAGGASAGTGASGGVSAGSTIFGRKTQPVNSGTTQMCHPGEAACDSSSLMDRCATKADAGVLLSPEEGWQRLMDAFINEGVLVRTHDKENKVKELFSGQPVSACWLLPGLPVKLFSRGYERPPGVIISARCDKVARFKENATTIRVNNDYSAYDKLPKGIQTLSSGFSQVFNLRSGLVFNQSFTWASTQGDHYFKNHKNDYSFLMKLEEMSLFREGIQVRRATEPSNMHSREFSFKTSGHLSLEGGYIEGKPKLCRLDIDTIPLINNEVVIRWDEKVNKVMGFMLQGPITAEKIQCTIHTINLLEGQFPEKVQYILKLPVVEYEPSHTQIRYLGSTQSFKEKAIFCEDDYFSNTIQTYTLYKALNSNRLSMSNLLNGARFFDNIQRLSDAVSVNCNVEINTNFKTILLASTHRQLLEHECNCKFTEDEALLLAYAAALFEAIHSMDKGKAITVLEWFRLQMVDSKVPESLINIISHAMSIHSVQALTGSPRAMMFRYIITGSIQKPEDAKILPFIFPDMSEEKLRTVAEAFGNITKILTEMIIPVTDTKKEPTWLLMINTLAMAIPAKVVELVKNSPGAENVDRWPYDQLMLFSLPASREIYRKASLLDHVEACSHPERSSFIRVQAEHYRQKGLPKYPGTICSLSNQIKDFVECQLAKQPDASLIALMTSNFTAVSKSWEKPHWPVWFCNPVERMENLFDYPFNGYTEFKGIKQNKEVLKSLKSYQLSELPDDWKCPVCLVENKDLNDKQDKVLELRCKHLFHHSCIEQLIAHEIQTCPECRAGVYPFRVGNQPPGSMEWMTTGEQCVGEDAAGSIKIIYNIPAGTYKTASGDIQYPPDRREAYLPDNQAGRTALIMLKTAFERGLVLTVGHSLSRNINNVVTWNDIPHKTTLFGGAHGFPDPAYVNRLIDTLKELDIPITAGRGDQG